MKQTVIAISISICLCGCTSNIGFHQKSETPEDLTIIKYSIEPFRTFEIIGTGVKGVNLDELTESLMRHQKEHPKAVYEVVAEVKCIPKHRKRITSAIQSTGINLKHYWAPVSFVDKTRTPGKYGAGFVDILEH